MEDLSIIGKKSCSDSATGKFNDKSFYDPIIGKPTDKSYPEKDLSAFLQNDIDTYIDGEKNADYLRNKYLLEDEKTEE